MYIHHIYMHMTITTQHVLNVKLIYDDFAAKLQGFNSRCGSCCRSSRQPCRNTPRNVSTIRTSQLLRCLNTSVIRPSVT